MGNINIRSIVENVNGRIGEVVRIIPRKGKETELLVLTDDTRNYEYWFVTRTTEIIDKDGNPR
jgi:hypothetical protein